MKKISLKKIATCGVLSGLALISFVIESALPPLFIPGARLGVSNVFILLSAILLGSPYAVFTLIIKTVLGSVFSGNMSALLYSLPSGLVALFIELLLINKARKLSIPAVSLVGAVINNVIQNVVFCLITSTWDYLTYSSYLMLIGLASGLFVGFAVYLVIKLVPNSVYDKINQ